MSDLQQDVRDIIDTGLNVGELFLLSGRLRTKSGGALLGRLRYKLEFALDAIIKLEGEVSILRAEVDGLRSQNEIMTRMLE